MTDGSCPKRYGPNDRGIDWPLDAIDLENPTGLESDCVVGNLVFGACGKELYDNHEIDFAIGVGNLLVAFERCPIITPRPAVGLNIGP